MKKILIPSITLLSLCLFFQNSAQAEDLNQLTKLLSSKNCVSCDLSNAGLVNANLAGGDLRKSNLVNANLGGANLAGANLSGANLTGASLNGANLTGANLTGANLSDTDLRSAYLQGATITSDQLKTAYIQGATGIPQSAGTPDLFYSWGVMEMNKGNYKSSLDYYDKAVALKPDFAKAYLARALSEFRLGRSEKATEDAKAAKGFFEAQKNQVGVDSSENFIKSIEIASKPTEVKPSEPDFLDFVQAIAQLAIQFIH